MRYETSSEALMSVHSMSSLSCLRLRLVEWGFGVVLGVCGGFGVVLWWF